jgi:hypothetical protein
MINLFTAVLLAISTGLVAAIMMYFYNLHQQMVLMGTVLTEHEELLEELITKHNELVYVINDAIKKDREEYELMNTLAEAKNDPNIGQA